MICRSCEISFYGKPPCNYKKQNTPIKDVPTSEGDLYIVVNDGLPLTITREKFVERTYENCPCEQCVVSVICKQPCKLFIKNLGLRFIE